jgi:phage-related protein
MGVSFDFTSDIGSFYLWTNKNWPEIAKVFSCFFNWLSPRLYRYTKFCMFGSMADLKPIEFRGSALDDLRAFPQAIRREAGYQLDQIQRGREPDDWKPINTVGQGVREIRIREASGAFRVLYVTKFEDAIYVLHCFQKKAQKTRKADLNLAAQRYRDLLKELGR